MRHAEAAAQRPRPAPNRRHLTKQQRERRLQRLVVGGAVIVVLLAILIPAYGYWHEVLRQGDLPVATVGGTPISAEAYARYLGTRRTVLTRQLTQLQRIARPANAKPTDKPTPAQQAAQQQLQTLQSQQSGLQVTALSDLIEARLLLDEARTRNLTASQAELDDALRWIMSPPQPSVAAPGTGLAGVPSPLPTGSLISLDEAKLAETQIVGNGRYLTADQFTQLVVTPAVLKTKLVGALAPKVASTEEEVHARHILVKTKEEADAIETQLKGGADFAALARDKSTDTSTKDKGGDLGWFGKGVMVPEFEKGAFSLSPGQTSDPVQSSFGFHVIQVQDKDPNHPIDPQRLEQLRTQPYQQWLNQAMSNQQKVEYSSNQSLLTWVSSYVQQGN